MKNLFKVILITSLSLSFIASAKPLKVKSFNSAKEMVAFANTQVESISAAKFKTLKLDPKTYLFDVRSSKEVSKGYVFGAISVPRGLLEFKLTIAKKWKSVKTTMPMPTKDSKIYIYCAKGSRGALAALSLRQLGFENVINVTGGYSAYKKVK